MEQIKTAIAPMFETKNALEEAAMNIFLTMKGGRPACPDLALSSRPFFQAILNPKILNDEEFIIHRVRRAR